MHLERTIASSDTPLLCSKWQRSCENYVNNCNPPVDSKLTAENSTNSTNDTPATTEPAATPATTTVSPRLQQSNWYKSQVWHSCCSVAVTAMQQQQQQSSITGPAAPPSGVYSVNGLFGSFTQSQAYCDVDGGWTVIQKRFLNSTMSFNRTMDDYVDGFGDLESDFWYGLFKIQILTKKVKHELKITFTTTDGEVKTSNYAEFEVKGDDYTLSLGTHEGVDYDYMSQFKDRPFVSFGSTDGPEKTCAETNLPNLLGGWWYTPRCLGDKGVNLNGVFVNDSADQLTKRLYIKSSEMKIRPINCISRGTAGLH